MSAEATTMQPPKELLGADRSQTLGATLEQLRKLAPMITLAGVRGSAIALQFASQILVGMLAGASGLGILQLVTSWTCMVGEFIALGLPARAMRRIAVDYSHHNKGDIEQLLRSSREKIITAWLLFIAFGMLVGALFLLYSPFTIGSDYFFLALTAVATAPLFALMKLYAESLKATGKTLLAVSFESVTSPVALLVLCLICWIYDKPAAAISLVATFTLSVAIAAIAMKTVLKKQLDQISPINVSQETLGQVQSPKHTDLFFLWSASVLSIAFLHLPFLVMPYYMSTAEIGVFSIAHKMVNVITTLLLLLAAIYGPAFARAAAEKDAKQLAKVLRRTQAICSAIFIPTAALLVLFANPLAALFGEEFADLQIFLLILCAGQLINAVTGLSGVLLNMSGAASRELMALVLAIGLAVIGSHWAGPLHGAAGLAAVFSASIAIKNIASFALARQALRQIGDNV